MEKRNSSYYETIMGPFRKWLKCKFREAEKESDEPEAYISGCCAIDKMLKYKHLKV